MNLPSPGRLRIAYVVHDYTRHVGQGRYVVELATRFRHRHDVHVYCNTVDDGGDHSGITFHHVPAWRANALTAIGTFILPATVLVPPTFDIVHAQGLNGLRQNVITAHMCQPAWFAAADRHGESPRWRKRVFRSVVTKLERLVMRPGGARAFIAPSARVATDLATYCGLNGSRVHVVPHGTDVETFHPRHRATWRSAVRAELGLADDAVVALYVGDLQKGMPAAIRAVARAPGVTLVAVSRTPVGPYAGLAAAEDVTDRVRFVPFRAEINRVYAAADVFLLPTYYDTFGLVITEAMASALPVVTSREAGAAQLIDHGSNGLLTSRPWDADEIAAHLIRLRDDPALRERMGGAARATVEPLTWDRTAEQTFRVYEQVVGRRRDA